MLSLGEQLYRLTARDEETLLMEQIFRTLLVTVNAGQVTAFVDIPVPKDRAIFIDRIIFIGTTFAPAVGNWIAWNVSLLDTIGETTLAAVRGDNGGVRPLIGDGVENTVVPAAGEGVFQTVDVKTIFPPGWQTLRFQTYTTVKPVANAVSSIRIHGYYIPPGRISRR